MPRPANPTACSLSAVLPYLQSHDAYGVDECLQHCLEHGVQVRWGSEAGLGCVQCLLCARQKACLHFACVAFHDLPALPFRNRS